MANFEAFRQVISSSINLLFLKSVPSARPHPPREVPKWHITYCIFFIRAIILVLMVSLVYCHCVGGAEDPHHFSHVDMDSCS